MGELKLEIKDYYVLLNLHKALLEAKFHTNPDNPLVSASPIIADLSNELVDILMKMDALKNESRVEGWKKWRKIEGQLFYKDRAVKNATLTNRWLELNDEEKIKYVKTLLSPFEATEQELLSIIEEIEEEFVNKR